MSLLKQSEQQQAFCNDDRQQINRARKEAEALFRPKPQSIKPSTSADPPPADSSARKPRVLSASAPPVDRITAKAPISSEPQIKPAVSVSQLARIHLERLNSARAAIFNQQHELQAKLDAIESEMRAIDAYEAAKNGKSSLGHRRSKHTHRAGCRGRSNFRPL
jgi:hypothetical protein